MKREITNWEGKFYWAIQDFIQKEGTGGALGSSCQTNFYFDTACTTQTHQGVLVVTYTDLVCCECQKLTK